MKPLAVFPLLALLALTGCSPTPNEDTPGHYSPSALDPVTNRNLTADDNALLDAGKTKITVGDKTLPYAVTVTDSDGKTKNGDFTQGKHIRIILDTGSFVNCTTEQNRPKKPNGFYVNPGDDGTADCIYAVDVRTAPSQDTKYGQGDEMGSVSSVLHGRNVIEANAINGGYVGLTIDLGSGKSSSVNAISGAPQKSETLSRTQRVLHPELTPGLTDEQTQELAKTTPQYTSGNYSMTVGKPTITKDANDRTTLRIPLTTNLPTGNCFTTEGDCTDLFINTTSAQTPTALQRINQPEKGLTVPAGFTGVLTVDSPNFDAARLNLGVRSNGNMKDYTINLLTGEAEH